jgi:hypothetical protein
MKISILFNWPPSEDSARISLDREAEKQNKIYVKN